MIRFLLFFLPLFSVANQIIFSHVEQGSLGKIIHTNAQIEQLTEQQQIIVSRLSGHIEEYYVSAGESLKIADKIALVESIELSQMTAEYVALLAQTKASKKQLHTVKTLHSKGLSSQNDISNAIIMLEEIYAKQNTLESQLNSLGIKPETLKKATDKFTIYAHAEGVVGEILTPLHSNIDAKTPLMSLIKKGGYHATAFLSISDAMKTDKDTKGYIDITGKAYPCHFVQLLPNIDEETQRAKVRFSINNSPDNLLLGAFTKIKISLPPSKDVLMVKKSGITLFQGEWVVFVKTDATAHDESEHQEDSHEGHGHDTLDDTHDTHEGHGHDEHKEETTKKDEHDSHEGHNHAKEAAVKANTHAGHGHDEHKEETTKKDAHAGHGHDEHEEEPRPYKARVVSIIAYAGDYVAIKGLVVGEEYVSDGVWFVKSMLLRSSLGGHGH